MGATRAQGHIGSSDSLRLKQSAVVAHEIFHDIGAINGMNYISYPHNGSWRIDTLSFRPSKTTALILKRPETSTFPIFARFCNNRITGETICESSDGTPVVTIDDKTLRFRFDPFAMYMARLSEGFQSSRISFLKQSALKMYWHMPPFLRRGVSRISRRCETSHVCSLRDFNMVGVQNNVIVHLIERHLHEIGLLKGQARPSFAAITHDVDTDFCQKEGREMIASIENEEDVNATWFFVPRSVRYTLDKTAVRRLTEESHEIGMHGYSHGGRLALFNAEKLAKQLRKGKRILESTGTKVQSFRSPYTLRSLILLQTLVQEGFNIDSSYTDVDTFGMAGGLKGLSYNRPHRPLTWNNKSLSKPLPIWEVPITCPQDVHLLESFRVTDEQLLQVWRYKADFCKDFGGVFVLLTHPVHIVRRIEAFAQFLRYLKSKGFRFSTLNSLSHSIRKSGNHNQLVEERNSLG